MKTFTTVMAILFLSTHGFSAEAESASAEVQFNLNVVWTCIAAFLVMFMQAGFAMVEAGFTRAKNAINILMKNCMDFCFGSVAFFLVGFGIMFGVSRGGIIGTSLFGLKDVTGGDWAFSFWMFQVVFAATAATIVSGAMAERTKFRAYIFYSVLITIFIYPMFGKWAWGSLLLENGSGWLENLGFIDFAGSTVVHSVGGWLALAGAIILGPRMGKYSIDKKPKALPGHNLPLAGLGVFILWFGWFGFNPGSTTEGTAEIGRIAVTTNLSGAGGAISAMIASWIMFKKPDASMTLNGALAGLVGITAPCYTVTPFGALIIGLVSGIIVVLSVVFLDSVLCIDDPVGAVSVHGICGAWGTIAAGLFGAEKILGVGEINTGLFYGGGVYQAGIQTLGVAAAFAWAFGTGLLMFTILKHTIGLRVSREEELRGLDIGEHGMEAYGGFQIFTTQ